HLDVRSDIYSLGATLYFLLTARAPFDGTGVNLIASILTNRPKPPASVRKEIPKPVSDLVMRCLEKNPADRVPDYTILQELLSSFSSVHPKPASPGLRIAAGMFDYFLLNVIQITALAGILASRGLSFFYLLDPPRLQSLSALTYLVPFTYYTVSEGLWG